jgi:L-serine dehydratase
MLLASDISVFDMFKIGIGPSSSHTMGPLVAARRLRELLGKAEGGGPWRLEVELYGSLSATGPGHRIVEAICAGLLGLDAGESPVEAIWAAEGRIRAAGGFQIEGRRVEFDPESIRRLGRKLDGRPIEHPNTLRFILQAAGVGRDCPPAEKAEDRRPKAEGTSDSESSAYGPRSSAFLLVARSVGGGFVEFEGEEPDFKPGAAPPAAPIPHPFDTTAELIARCEAAAISPVELALANETARGIAEPVVRARLARIWSVMDASIARGLATEGTLPGGLEVTRRAPGLIAECQAGRLALDRVPDLRLSAYAMAVNEENAAGGRVVTAPTNGAAGLLPAVLKELAATHQASPRVIEDGLLVAGLVGALVKRASSISGAEVGCQGEVGTACAMAAAATVVMLGGGVRAMEAAAEIAIEHHLGLTCDPVGGLVQIPCIERNAMGAVQAMGAAMLALAGGGRHKISLDRALRVMKQTGLDMKLKYKETGTGGLGIG